LDVAGERAGETPAQWKTGLMSDDVTRRSDRAGGTRKRGYVRPRLEALGPVHLVTQGSGVMGADGALGMTRDPRMVMFMFMNMNMRMFM
jgi:hypothetical protein